MSTSEVPAPELPAWLAPSLPWPRRAFELGSADGRRMHVIDTGPTGDVATPVVLLVHGNPTWSYLWRKVIAALQPGVRCVAPDLIGFGLSDKPRDPAVHQLAFHLDALVELVDVLDPASLILVGQDWGGPLAMGVGMWRPDRVVGRVLANTAVLPPRRPPRPTAFHRLSQTALGTPLLHWINGVVHAMPRVQGDPTSLPRAVRRAYRWPLRRLADRAAPLGFARMVPDRDDHPSLELADVIGRWTEAWSGPTAFVWGRRDPILGRTFARHRRALEPGYVVETQAGHFLQEEVPQAIADAIRWTLAQR